MNVMPEVSLHNKFHFELLDTKTGKLKQEAWAYNVVTNLYYTTLQSKNQLIISDIEVGTGTGTPEVTDTALFHYLGQKLGTRGNVTPLGNYRYSQTLTTTFTENEVNGTLTEVGLCSSNTTSAHQMYTHAMLTDSEGHAISIVKTAADRLTVTATLYLSLTYPAGITPYDVVYDNYTISLNPKAIESISTPSARVPDLIYRCFGRGEVNSYMSLGICLAKDTPFTPYTFSVSSSQITDGLRGQSSRVLSTEWNRDYTYQIFGIATTIGVIPLPNHTLFPPINLELNAVGDGATTGFNFGIAELMSDVQVYVNGTLQNASTYRWNRKDFNLRQAWISQHGTYLVSQPRVMYEIYRLVNSPVIDNQSYNKMMDDAVYIYDFTAPYTVNAIKSTTFRVELYYSSDSEHWTLAHAMTPSFQNEMHTFPAISARYWKLVFPDGINGYTSPDVMYAFLGAFDNVSNQLEFNTAPANGAVIKVVAKSEYPIKNSNWIIDQVVQDVTFTRSVE